MLCDLRHFPSHTLSLGSAFRFMSKVGWQTTSNLGEWDVSLSFASFRPTTLLEADIFEYVHNTGSPHMHAREFTDLQAADI